MLDKVRGFRSQDQTRASLMGFQFVEHVVDFSLSLTFARVSCVLIRGFAAQNVGEVSDVGRDD